MEDFQIKEKEIIVCDRDFILRNLKLIPSEQSESEDFLKLETDWAVDRAESEHSRIIAVENPEELFEYFDGIKTIKPDRVSRPKGDTTFFTSAGVQHIETIFRETGKLERESFVVAQPVIRSQFMDRVKEGTSTSFVNFSVGHIDSTPEEFLASCKALIKLIHGRGGDSKNLRFKIENTPDQWGRRKFTKTVFTVYVNSIEVGECVYMHDYPVVDDQKVNITDVGLGVERLNFALEPGGHFFPEFGVFYEKAGEDDVVGLIDCVRTAVLIAREDIQPSNHDAGYRLRQLSRRFVSRNKNHGFDMVELVHIAYKYWEKWGSPATVGEEDVARIIQTENDRNYNALLLTLLKQEGESVYIEINQPTDKFLKQLRVSLPKSKTLIDKIIGKLE